MALTNKQMRGVCNMFANAFIHANLYWKGNYRKWLSRENSSERSGRMCVQIHNRV